MHTKTANASDIDMTWSKVHDYVCSAVANPDLTFCDRRIVLFFHAEIVFDLRSLGTMGGLENLKSRSTVPDTSKYFSGTVWDLMIPYHPGTFQTWSLFLCP